MGFGGSTSAAISSLKYNRSLTSNKKAIKSYRSYSEKIRMNGSVKGVNKISKDAIDKYSNTAAANTIRKRAYRTAYLGLGYALLALTSLFVVGYLIFGS